MSGIENFQELSEDGKFTALRDKFGGDYLSDCEKFYNTFKKGGEGQSEGPPPISADNLEMFVGLIETYGNEKIHNYQNAFMMFDKDTNGEIDTDEFAEIMASVDNWGLPIGEKTTKVPKTLEQREKDINFVTGGKRDVVTFKDFCSIVENEQPYGDSQEKIIRCYSALDTDQSGKVNAAELKHILLSFGTDEEFSEAEIDEMVKEAGIDSNGCIDYQTWSQKLFAKPP